jgi:hypothetical protein
MVEVKDATEMRQSIPVDTKKKKAGFDQKPPVDTELLKRSLNERPLKQIEILTCILVVLCIIPLVMIPVIKFINDIRASLGYSALFTKFEFFFCAKPYFFYSALVSITTLLGLLLLGRDELLTPEKDNGPVVRRALVGSMVVAYFSFMAVLLSVSEVKNLSPEILRLFDGLGQMVTIIMGFYFGAGVIKAVTQKVVDYKSSSGTSE